MQQHTPKIGAFVLESLTTGMYAEPLDAVRELVQNASDAIRDAERQELIAPDRGRIQIDINAKARCLCVKDTGTGIPKDLVLPSLLNVGMSAKSIELDAGFRGIGRLAAIAYCDSMVFRTTALGEGVTTVLALNCKGIRQGISPVTRKSGVKNVAELSEILWSNADVSEERADKESHGFEVRLEGIGKGADAFLDLTVMERYLSQVAPVDFDRQRFMYAQKIDKWAKDHGFAIPKVTLELRTPPNGSRAVYKHYKSHYKPSQGDEHFQIKDVAFFQAEGPHKESFWVWYGVNNDFPGMIDDEHCRGLRHRKQNIGLGHPERVAELFERIAKSNGRFNNYFIGELHIAHPLAVPNARRDGFEQEGVWPEIADALRPFLESRCSDVRQGSQTRNQTTDRVIQQISNTTKEVEKRVSDGLMAEAEKAELTRKLEVAKEKASLACGKKDRSDEDKDRIRQAVKQLDIVEQKLRAPSAFVGGKTKTHLDRKQRRVLQDVLEIVYGALGGVKCGKSDACAASIKHAVMEKYGTDDTGAKQ